MTTDIVTPQYNAEVRPQEGAAGSLRQQWPERIYLLLFPLIAFWGLHYLPRVQNHFLDPYVYTGFINNFSDLFERFGLTYYGVRFGLILPARAATAIFGPEIGYFVLRYLLALLFGISLYRVCKRYLSTAVAIVIYAIAVGTPYFARALLWDHPDATGVPFLTAAICLFLLGHERRYGMSDFLAGCCAAMAIHSNVFTLALAVILAIVYFVCSVFYGEPALDTVKRFLYSVAGALTITILGAVYYGLSVGYFDIFHVTLDTAVSLSKGGFRQWRLNGFDWTFTNYHVFLPIWLSICTILIALRRRPSFFAAVVTLFGIAVTTFYYVHQFLLEGDSLQLFYYFSYAAPSVFLMLALILEDFRETARTGTAGFASATLPLAFIPLLAVSFGAKFTFLENWKLFVGVGLAAGAMIVVKTFVPSVARFAAWSGTILVVVSLQLAFAGYCQIIQSRASSDTSENDVYRVALQLIKVMPNFSKTPKGLFFLYDTHRPSLNSVQSTYLWGYSLLQYDPSVSNGNRMNPDFLDTFKFSDRYLCVLGEQPNEVATEVEDLRTHGVPFKELETRMLESGKYRIYYKLLDVGQPARDVVLNGDFESGILPWRGGWAQIRTISGGQSGNCLELNAEQGPAQHAIQVDTVRLQPRVRYRLTFWVKSGSSGDERFEVGLWNPRKSRFDALQSGRSAADWKEFRLEFVGASADLLSPEIIKNSKTQGSMLFDSLNIERLN
jgi:hypothetical protein